MQCQDRTGHWAHATRHGAQATRVAELRFNARGINVTHDRVAARRHGPAEEVVTGTGLLIGPDLGGELLLPFAKAAVIICKWKIDV